MMRETTADAAGAILPAGSRRVLPPARPLDVLDNRLNMCIKVAP